jgi:hypothetical protein
MASKAGRVMPLLSRRESRFSSNDRRHSIKPDDRYNRGGWTAAARLT